MTTKNEKITLAFSITAFLVSIAAILVSIAIFRATTSSVIQASVGYKQRPEYVRFTETGDSRYPVSYAQEMPIRIANVGNEASTIIEMRVLVLEAENITGISHPLELIEGDGVRRVSKAAAVLNPTYSDRDGNPVRWPIKLEPRDSIAIELKMNIGIPEKIWSTVKDHVPLATPTKEDSVVELLEKLGIPKWGQLIPGKTPRSPTSLYRYYRLQIIKEDGSVVTANFDLDYYLPPQGEKLPSPWDW